MSLRLTPNAHKKNKLVINTKGTRNRRSVSGAEFDEDAPPDPAPVVVEIFIASMRHSRQRPIQMYIPAIHI